MPLALALDLGTTSIAAVAVADDGRLVAQVQLLPHPAQAASLVATLERLNRAGDAIAALAWAEHVFSADDLHQRCYHNIRAQFGLSAQIVVHALAKVGAADKLDRATPRTCRPPKPDLWPISKAMSWPTTSSALSLAIRSGLNSTGTPIVSSSLAMAKAC